jgi:PKD repeat protein
VTFDGSNSKQADVKIVSYNWDFGDGSPQSTQMITTHTYTIPGTYTARLTVKDDKGAAASDQAIIIVEPVIIGAISVTVPISPNAVIFLASYNLINIL